MEFAISWLPIIGCGLLWAIAISAWFSADKQIAAVWFAFAGSIFLLITLALQAHLYVATFVAQPKIELEAPVTPTHFRWQVAQSPMFRAPGDSQNEGVWSTPKFKLKNASSIFAADVTIEWFAPNIDPINLGNASPQLKKLTDNIHDYGYLLRVKGQDASTFSLNFLTATRNVIAIPFLNREVSTFIPSDVFLRSLLLVFAKLPDQPGNETFDIEYRAVVTWNIPDRGKPQTFVVMGHVRNTKQLGDAAIMDADITFEVQSTVQRK